MEEPKVVIDPDSEIILLTVVMIIFVIIGLVGNLAAIFVIVVLKEYQKSVTHWYVLQLSIAGTVFLLSVPFKVSESLHKAWIYSEWMCKAIETILFLNYYASILFLSIMSIDRYIAVCRPLSSRLQRLRRRTSAFIIAMSLWGTALLMCIPIMLYTYKVGTHPKCICSYEFRDRNNITGELLCYDDYSTNPEALEACLNGTNIFPEYLKSSTEKHCLRLDDSAILGLFSGLESFENYENFDWSSYQYGSQDSASNTATSNNSPINTASNSSSTLDKIPDFNFTSFDLSLLGVSNTKTHLISGESEEKKETPTPPPTTTSTQFNSKIAIDVGCYTGKFGNGWIAFVLFNFSAMFILPVLIMTMCYGLIVHRLFQTRMSRTTSTSSSVSFTQSFNSGPGGSQKRKRKLTARSDKDRIRVTLMCSVLVISFLVLWLPFHSFHLAKLIGIPYGGLFCQRFGRATAVLGYLTAVINPYLYSFLGTRFEKRWKSATKTVRRSITKRRKSSSSAGSLYYLQRRTTSMNQTCVSRLNKTDTNPKLFVGTINNTEVEPSSPDKDTKNSLSGSPPPDYENFLPRQDGEENEIKE